MLYWFGEMKTLNCGHYFWNILYHITLVCTVFDGTMKNHAQLFKRFHLINTLAIYCPGAQFRSLRKDQDFRIIWLYIPRSVNVQFLICSLQDCMAYVYFPYAQPAFPNWCKIRAWVSLKHRDESTERGKLYWMKQYM